MKEGCRKKVGINWSDSIGQNTTDVSTRDPQTGRKTERSLLKEKRLLDLYGDTICSILNKLFWNNHVTMVKNASDSINKCLKLSSLLCFWSSSLINSSSFHFKSPFYSTMPCSIWINEQPINTRGVTIHSAQETRQYTIF